MYMPSLLSSFFNVLTTNDIDEFADDEPSDMLFCRICRKIMRDVASFENHIKSRPHLVMCETIEESYLHKVEMYRHAAHIDTQLYTIRMHGQISAKQIFECPSQTQKLVQPKCVECNLVFCTRYDYAIHLLTSHAIIPTAEQSIQVGDSQLHGDDPSPSERSKMTEDAEVERECQETEEVGNNAANEDADEARGSKDLTETKMQEEVVVGSPYDNLPNDVFYCHLCHERMLDAKTFAKHIIGRSHSIMLEEIAEGYRLKANIIRLKAKNIVLSELTNRNKHCTQKYCGMCDLHYHCPNRVHYKSEGHMELKKLFYPKCRVCGIQFYNRLAYDKHLLSPKHLTELSESRMTRADVENYN